LTITINRSAQIPAETRIVQVVAAYPPIRLPDQTIQATIRDPIPQAKLVLVSYQKMEGPVICQVSFHPVTNQTKRMKPTMETARKTTARTVNLPGRGVVRFKADDMSVCSSDGIKMIIPEGCYLSREYQGSLTLYR